MSAHTFNTGQSEAKQSQSKINIQPRHVKFDFADIQTPFFYQDNPCISAVWVSLSASFPLGEAEFIKSTKQFEHNITDPKLKAEVKKFAQQEAHHSLQHRRLNQAFEATGYPVTQLEAEIKKELLAREQKWSIERRLANTVAAEHVTATMANWALTHPEHMAHFPESLRELFQWHAIEEIEHKSVTFDVYQHCVGRPALLRWQYRYFLYFHFPFSVYLSTRFLLKTMGYKATKADLQGLHNFLFGKGGMIADRKHHYSAFNKKGFHPWQIDDAGLVDEWQMKLEPHFV